MRRILNLFVAAVTGILLLTPGALLYGGQTIEQWGSSHYNNYGKAEGRTLTASGDYGDYVREYSDLLSAYNATAATATTTTTTSDSCYGDYVRNHADLLAVYNGSGGGQTIEAWGKSHYQGFGQAEGRTLPACSTSTATTSTATTSVGSYGDYVRRYADLLAVYDELSDNQTIESWGQWHWSNYGPGEGRTLATSSSTLSCPCSVTYEGNGNTGGSIPTDGNNYEQGATVIIKGNTGELTKTGYTFVGWKIGFTDYVEGATLMLGTSSIELSAKWVAAPSEEYVSENPNNVFVYYNGNGNTGGQPPSRSTHCPPRCSNLISDGANLSKTGYTFSGWNTAADGSGTAYAAAAYYYELTSFTLYAQWTATSGAGTISGAVWQDLNENGSFDSDEGIGDVRKVFLDGDGGSRQTYMTNLMGGNYSFGSLDAGTQYTVSMENVLPHIQTHLTPASVTVTLSPGEERTVDFGFTSPCQGLPSYQGCP